MCYRWSDVLQHDPDEGIHANFLSLNLEGKDDGFLERGGQGL